MKDGTNVAERTGRRTRRTAQQLVGPSMHVRRPCLLVQRILLTPTCSIHRLRTTGTIGLRETMNDLIQVAQNRNRRPAPILSHLDLLDDPPSFSLKRCSLELRPRWHRTTGASRSCNYNCMRERGRALLAHRQRRIMMNDVFIVAIVWT